MRKILIILVLLICLVSLSNAAIIYIDTDGSGDYNCDGTDDQIEINYAIDNASAHDIIQINSSIYNITGSTGGIYIHSLNNLTFQGEGIGNTILNLVDAEVPGQMFTVYNSTFIKIDKFTITSPYSYVANTGGCGLYINYADNSTFSNLWVEKTNIAVNVREDSHYNTFIDSVYTHNGAAFGMMGQTTHNTHNIVSNNVMNHSYRWMGLDLNAGNHLNIISNNIVHDSANAGIKVYCASWGNTFTNNTVYSNGQYGFQVFGGGHTAGYPNKFINNTVYDNDYAGFYFNSNYKNNGTLIRNNLIYENNGHGITMPIYEAYDYADYIFIHSNTIYGNAGYGIFNSMPNYILDVKNNIISNNTLDAINQSSTGNSTITSKYNLIYENGNTYSGTILNKTGDIFLNPYFYNTVLNNFHLNSTTGTWNSSGWENMSTNSLAIDAGDPNSNYFNEPTPNGNQINMGFYGNTEYASKSVSWSPDSNSTYDGQRCTYYTDGSRNCTTPTESDLVIFTNVQPVIT